MNLLGDILNIVPETDGGFHSIRMAVRQLAVTGRLPTRATGDKGAVKLLVELQGGGAWQDVDGSYELPHSWCWARFNQVAEIASNLVPPSKFMDVPHVAPDNIEKGTGRLLPYRTIREDGVTSGKHRFFPGQILYSKIRPNLSKAVTVDFEGLCSADMYPLSPRIDRGYLHLFLLSPVFLAQVVREDNRLAMPKVNQEQLSATVVAVPPLAEQKRIVAKVDQLMGLIDELEAKQTKKREVQTRFRTSALDALTKAEGPEELAQAWKRVAGNFGVLFERVESVPELRMAIFEQAVRGRLVQQFADDESAEHVRLRLADRLRRKAPDGQAEEVPRPFELPRGWAWAKLPELGEFGRGKSKHRPRNDPSLFSNGTYPLVQTGDVARSGGSITTYTSMYNEKGLAQSRVWPKGTLCITIAANIADSGILTFDACFPDSVVGFVPDPEIGDARYFEFFLRTAQQEIERFAPATAQKNINLEILSQVMVPLPPVPEIRRIVAKVEALMKLCDDLDAKLRAKEETAGKLVEAVVKELVV